MRYSKLLIALLPLVCLFTFCCAANCAITEAVSVTPTGHMASGTSLFPAISGDGRYVAFSSNANSLVEGVTDGHYQIFRRDTQTNTTTLISVATDGDEANADCNNPSMSADGRFVVFTSGATNLVLNVGDGIYQIYLRDTQLGTTTLVTKSATGWGNAYSDCAVISADANFVAFHSGASNLISGSGPTEFAQVYIWQRTPGSLSLASRTPSGERANGNSWYPSITSTGDLVAYYSQATNILAGITTPQIYLQDKYQNWLVSRDSAGNPVSGSVAYRAAVNSNGGLVAFSTDSANVMPGVGDGVHYQVYINYPWGGTNELVSTSYPYDGKAGDGDSFNPTFGDSMYVAFFSTSSNLHPLVTTSGGHHLYVRDRYTGINDLVSIGYDGIPRPDTGFRIAALSADSRYIAFQSGTSGLTSSPSYGFWQVYKRDTVQAPRNVSLTPSTGTIPAGPATFSAVYNDPNGPQRMRKLYLLINDSMTQSNAVLLVYDVHNYRAYLKNDANTSWGTGYEPETDVVMENSQCKVYLKDTELINGDTQATFKWRIELKAPFSSKQLNAYMYVQDDTLLTDGWEQMGLYHNVKPQVVSIAPNSGAVPIDSQTTLTSVYRDLNGYADLRKCYLVLCEGFDQANAALLFYDRTTNKVYLKNDANTSWGTGYAVGTDITLQNSQCVVYVKDIAVNGSGNDLTIQWSLKLKPSMTGKNLYSWMYTADMAGLYDGWKKLGTHFAPVAPTCISVTPSTGKVQTGPPLVFTSTYGDSNGTSDIYQCYFQMGQTGSLANAVYVLYDAKQGKVFLRNDGNTSWGTGYAPGASASLENSQCIVHLNNTTLSASDTDNLIVSWSITLKPVFIGKLLGQRMYCRDNEYLNSAWKLKGYVRGM